MLHLNLMLVGGVTEMIFWFVEICWLAVGHLALFSSLKHNLQLCQSISESASDNWSLCTQMVGAHGSSQTSLMS